MGREEQKNHEEEQKLAETVIELDPMSLKKLMMKLDSIEKHLRELRRHKKTGGDGHNRNNRSSMAQVLNTDSSNAKISQGTHHKQRPSGLDSVPSPSPQKNLHQDFEGKFSSAQTPQQDMRVHPEHIMGSGIAKKIDYSKLKKFIKK